MYSIPFLDIPPLQSAAGTVALPGSKSISNRVLLLSALCAGRTTIMGLLDSDDTRVMLTALSQLGCTVDFEAAPDAPTAGRLVHIQGIAGQPVTRSAKLFLGNAGTAMRPLAAALAVMGGEVTADGTVGGFELSGIARMHERPIGDLVDALQALGCDITYLGNAGYPPLRIGAPKLKLDAPIAVRGDVSSQFLTALLMAMPLAAKQDIVIDVVGELISKPYIDITLKMMAQFGVVVQRDGWSRFTIPQGSAYVSPKTIAVEADASSASYFLALGALASTEGVRIEGVGLDSIQGDIRFVDAARQMGAVVEGEGNALTVRRGRWPLKAIELDCNHIPDAAMTLAVMALYAQGTTRLTNIASWRVKETDRIEAMATELRKLGATVETGADFIAVTPPATPADWRKPSIHTYDDHRVAMCFSLAAFNPAKLPIRIEDPKCVAKTFPDYFEALFGLAKTEAAHIPVITIDGPSASGKGTLASRLAGRLGFHYLDSGALYRAVAWMAHQQGIALTPANEAALADMARHLPIHFEGELIYLNGEEVSAHIRQESTGAMASQVSVLPKVRAALLNLQHSFRRLPGLVTDGRDMGTVIFPDARLKVFLTATAQARAQRRYQQLLERGQSATIDNLLTDLQSRDVRDSTRSAAPLQSAQDAKQLDNSSLSIQESVDTVLQWWLV